MSELSKDHVTAFLNKYGLTAVPSAQLRDQDKYLDDDKFRYILWLDRIYQKISRVPGHILEIGVARGRNAIIFGHLIKMNGEEAVRKYFGIDTFDGFAEDDLRRDSYLSPEEWKSTTVEFVQDRIKQKKLAGVSFVFKGDVRDIGKDFVSQKNPFINPGKARFALLYIDCNAYDPAKFSMDFFYEYMSPGGIVCIDEKTQGGETEALVAFCKEKGLAFERDPGPFGLPAYAKVPG